MVLLTIILPVGAFFVIMWLLARTDGRGTRPRRGRGRRIEGENDRNWSAGQYGDTDSSSGGGHHGNHSGCGGGSGCGSGGGGCGGGS
jgi:hypothetical protein